MAPGVRHPRVEMMLLLLVFFFGYVSVQGQTTDSVPSMDTPPLLNFGPRHGDSKMSDLTVDEVVDLHANISYFGSIYRKIYISVDGLISFQPGMRYFKSIKWEEGTRNERTDKPFLAPFIYDGFKATNVNPGSYKGGIYYRVIDGDKLRKDGPFHHNQAKTLKWLSQYVKEATLNPHRDFNADLVIVVTWDNVLQNSDDMADITKCANQPDECKSSTFQAILVCDMTLQRTIAIFNYKKMDIPLQDSYQAGFNGGYGRDWFNVIPCHGQCSVDAESYLGRLPELVGSDQKGRFILDVGGERFVRGGCLPDEFTSGVLEVYPREVGMYGGEKLEVSGKCRDAHSTIYCRFGQSSDSPVVEGIMVNKMKGYCPVPLLTRKGTIYLAWSPDKDADTWSEDRTITVVLPGRMEAPVAVPKRVLDAWLSRDATEITVPWDPKKFTSATSGKVEIRLIGYREANGKVEYKILKELGSAHIQSGQYTFRVAKHRCTENCMDFEIGLLEVALKPEYLGIATERVAVRHGEIPLGWYVNEKMTQDQGDDWSDGQCKVWNDQDGKQTGWLSSLLPCPCTLSQALADFGRFQPDPGCNVFTGSKCTYHKGAKHCVRSIVPTKEGSGNQCCYNQNNHLLYSQLSYQGSTPDRSHSWGAAPYAKPDLVPSLSHWKHDVISFYYCCLWNNYDLCDLYMERRPTRDCRHYTPPGLATLRGVSHVTTFDGLSYQVLNAGDFVLLQTDDVIIQGRFGARRGGWDLGTLSGGSSWSPPVLQALAVEASGQIVDIHLAPENAEPPRGLDVQVFKERRFFFSESTMWQDFKGISVTNNALPDENNLHNNFTILTTSNVGVNVYSENGLLHVTVALPPEMKKESGDEESMGLFGTYNNVFSNKTTTPRKSNALVTQKLLQKWTVKEARNSLFHFFKPASPLDPEYQFANYTGIPRNFQGSPNDKDIEDACGRDANCKWDYLITGSADVAITTRDADQLFSYLQGSVQQVYSCGLPEVGRNAVLDKYNFAVGSQVQVTGCGKGMTFAGPQKYKCVKESKSEADSNDRGDYGLTVTDPEDSAQYLVHWLPRPTTLCEYSEEAEGGLDLVMIVGIVVGAVVLLAIIGVVIFIVIRRRRSRSDKYSSGNRPTPANRRSKESDPHDERSAQAMLPREVDRSPVYKPSRDPVQMSQGSAV